MSNADRERKKEYTKSHYHKRQIFLNYLIDCVEKLENISLSKKVLLNSRNILKWSFLIIAKHLWIFESMQNVESKHTQQC